MASPPGPHQRTPHRIPGVPHTYIDKFSNASPYQSYTPPRSSPDHAQHQESSSFSPQTNSQQIRVLQETIHRLQRVDASRAEVITEQRIEIAVLKNDLSHTRQKVDEKEAVVHGLGIAIGSITRGTAATPAPQALVQAGSSTGNDSNSKSRIKDLETEIERYRNSERRLRLKIQDLERGVEARSQEKERESDAVLFEREHRVQVRDDGWAAHTHVDQKRALNNGKGRIIGREVGLGLSSANPPQSQQEYRQTIKPELTASQLVGIWGEDSNAGSSTISDIAVAVKSFNPANADVGVCSLEDFFDNDGYPAPLNFPPALSGVPSTIPSTTSNEFAPSITVQSSSLSTDAQAPRIQEDERHIDEQIEENQKAMGQFRGMPTPGVIKTGFVLGGTFRGADYDKVKSFQPVQNFDRFVPRNFGYQPGQFRREPPAASRAMREPPLDKSLVSGLWDDSQDRSGAFQNHMRAVVGRDDRRGNRGDDTPTPDLFCYGIQYIPAQTDSNYLRTVIISNLPVGTTVLDVLSRVRGGGVISATVVKMGRIAPDTVQARVIFKHEAAAEEYVSYASSHPIYFSEDNVIAEVTLISTPTYPISAKIQSRLREQTRCLAIPSIPITFSLNALEHNLACGNGHRAQGLIEMYVDSSYTLHLEFSSIELANSAWNVLQMRSPYRGLQFKWEADPCAGDLDELQSKVAPRPKMFPDNWAENRGVEDTDGMARGVRKTFAALEKQKVVIPDFGVVKLQAASWADEVNDELEDGEISQTNVTNVPEDIGNIPSLSEHRNTKAIAASQSTTVQTNTTLKVLTIDQELTAALNSSSTNKELSTSTSTKPALSSQTRPIGLAGSKYANTILAFVDTDRRPRSFHRSTSSFTFDSPESSFSDETPVVAKPAAEQHFSNRTPQVNLHDLIKSERSSIASQGASQSVDEVNDNENEAKTENAIEEKKTEVIAKPRVQLFKWPRNHTVAGKKSGYDAQEKEIDEQNPRVSIEVLVTEPTSSVAQIEKGEIEEIVVNPDEIDLDDDDDDDVLAEESIAKAVKGPDPSPESSESIEVSSGMKGNIKIPDEGLELSVEPSNRMLSSHINDQEIAASSIGSA